jgi:hypothetical protein
MGKWVGVAVLVTASACGGTLTISGVEGAIRPQAVTPNTIVTNPTKNFSLTISFTRHLTATLGTLHLVAGLADRMLHLVTAIGTNTVATRSGCFGAPHAPWPSATAATTATTSPRSHVIHLLSFKLL